MSLWGRLWSLAYVWRSPWDIGGPRPELVHLVESHKLKPCKAIDLGCGTGENTIFLAQQGFDVTGVDISPLGIAKARHKAQIAGVSPTFLVGDVTNLTGVEGPFDLVVDNGCLHSLVTGRARESYMRTVLRLTQPGSRIFLRCFVKDPRRRFSFGLVEYDEVERRFSADFNIEDLEALPPGALWTQIDAAYLMIRKRDDVHSLTMVQNALKRR